MLPVSIKDIKITFRRRPSKVSPLGIIKKESIPESTEIINNSNNNLNSKILPENKNNIIIDELKPKRRILHRMKTTSDIKIVKKKNINIDTKKYKKRNSLSKIDSMNISNKYPDTPKATIKLKEILNNNTLLQCSAYLLDDIERESRNMFGKDYKLPSTPNNIIEDNIEDIEKGLKEINTQIEYVNNDEHINMNDSKNVIDNNYNEKPVNKVINLVEKYNNLSMLNKSTNLPSINLKTSIEKTKNTLLPIRPSRSPPKIPIPMLEYDIESLKHPGPYPEGINVIKREYYLSDKTFINLFKMNKKQFYQLKKWKQQELKKKFLLF